VVTGQVENFVALFVIDSRWPSAHLFLPTQKFTILWIVVFCCCILGSVIWKRVSNAVGQWCWRFHGSYTTCC